MPESFSSRDIVRVRGGEEYRSKIIKRNQQHKLYAFNAVPLVL